MCKKLKNISYKTVNLTKLNFNKNHFKWKDHAKLNFSLYTGKKNVIKQIWFGKNLKYITFTLIYKKWSVEEVRCMPLHISIGFGG